MISMGKQSRMSPSEVMERAYRFFGPEGVGMKVVEREVRRMRFELAGGHVMVRANKMETQQLGSKVSVHGQEWEYQVRRFMELI